MKTPGITTIPSADREKATVQVRIGFDALDARVLPDMGVKVAFLSEENAAEGGTAKRLVEIPRAAVRGSGGSDYVLVVAADSKVERRAVVEGPAELAAGTKVREISSE